MPSSLHQLADALFADRHGQPLTDWIQDRRDADQSWRQISNELRDLTDGVVDLPPQTLINWTERSKAAA